MHREGERGGEKKRERERYVVFICLFRTWYINIYMCTYVYIYRYIYIYIYLYFHYADLLPQGYCQQHHQRARDNQAPVSDECPTSHVHLLRCSAIPWRSQSRTPGASPSPERPSALESTCFFLSIIKQSPNHSINTING